MGVIGHVRNQLHERLEKYGLKEHAADGSEDIQYYTGYNDALEWVLNHALDRVDGDKPLLDLDGDDEEAILNIANDHISTGNIENSDIAAVDMNLSVTTTEGDVKRWGQQVHLIEEVGGTNEKGDRNEREAANIIGRVRGKGNVEKVDAYSNSDPFGFVDVLAVGDGKILVVQVKTNRFTAEDRRKYKSRMRRLPFDHATFEVWVRVDYEGWRMYRYNPEDGEFHQYIKMDTCDHEATVEAYREAVGYYQTAGDDGE